MNQPKVSVAILNWNGKSWLERFLPFVLKSSYPNLELIVIDNGSTDDSVNFVKTQYPEVNLLLWDKNHGFTEGYNLVLPHIDAPYLVLLNSDVEVPKDWIQPLVQAMEAEPELISVQPKVLAMHDKHVFEYAGAAGGFIDYFGYPFCRGRVFDTVEKDTEQYDTYREVFWATGACCMVRVEAVRKIGLFQKEFFAHMEEIDFCWRAKNMGYKVACEPKSVVYHVGGGALPPSSPFKTYLNVRNSLAVLLLNLPGKQVFPKIFARLCLDGVWGVRSLLKGEFKYVWAILRAHFAFYGKLPHWIRTRKTQYAEAPQQIPSAGYFPGSVVWRYFISGRKKFSEIVRGE